MSPATPESRRKFMRESLRRLARYGASFGEVVKEIKPNLAALAAPPAPPKSAKPAAALPAAPQTIWLNSKHGMSYVRLGATGLMASRLALGCGRIRKSNLDCVEAALDAGVNLVLTAPNYGESETALASIRAKIDQRAWLCSQMPPHEAQSKSESECAIANAFWDRLETSLARLEADHLDLYFVQAGGNADVARNPALQEAVHLAREQGKIRRAGIATHKNAAGVLGAALEAGTWDAMMAPLGPFNLPRMAPLLDRLREREIGFIGTDADAGLAGEADAGELDLRELPADLDAAQVARLYMLKNAPHSVLLEHPDSLARAQAALRVFALDPGISGWNEVDPVIEQELWPICSVCGEQRTIDEAGLEAIFELNFRDLDVWARASSQGGARDAAELIGVCERCKSEAADAPAAGDIDS